MLVSDVVRRKAIDALLEAARIDGGPDEATLLEVGLAVPAAPAPDAADDDDAVPGEHDVPEDEAQA
jgi:hypothetical protein